MTANHTSSAASAASTRIVIDIAYLDRHALGLAHELQAQGHAVQQADLSSMIDWMAGIAGLDEAQRADNEVLVHLIYNTATPPRLSAFVRTDLMQDYQGKAFDGYYAKCAFVVEGVNPQLAHDEVEIYTSLAQQLLAQGSSDRLLFIGSPQAAESIRTVLQAHAQQQGEDKALHMTYYGMEIMEMTPTQIPLGLPLLTAFGVSLEKLSAGGAQA